MPGGQYFVAGKGGGGLFIIAEKPASPPTWLTYFDNTYWTGSVGAWIGGQWQASGANLEIIELGSWVEGFRPSAVRVTTGAIAPTLFVYDSSLNQIGFDASYVSGESMSLDFSGFGDIYRLRVLGLIANSPTTTNIEFYG